MNGQRRLVDKGIGTRLFVVGFMKFKLYIELCRTPMKMARIISLVVIVAIVSGCLQVAPQPAVPPTTMSSWSPMGGFTMTSGSSCAGTATLSMREMSISASCITGSDNIVMCTDTTAPNPVMCRPADGYLSISGTIGDTIAYARVH